MITPTGFVAWSQLHLMNVSAVGLLSLFSYENELHLFVVSEMTHCDLLTH